MGLVSMPTTTIFRTTPISHSDSLSFTSQSPVISSNLLYMHTSSQIHSPFAHQSVLIRSSFYARRTSLLLPVLFNAKNSEPSGAEEEEDDDSRALETVLKLYTAIKNKSIECNKTHVPLGKGFSFHICQVYHGKVIIRNVEMFMEPLLHMEPFRLKMIGYMTTIMEKMSSNPTFRDKAKGAGCILLIVVFLVVASLLFFKFTQQALP
ncbi:hypothetical protein FNV43_RR07918 [Rhamnella rubrinervis]|uniref:Uncharacterized protein n=1 Tax=Rhamnella rubrinervis TaxID=2594499 RepID=A0A8K0MMT1_9ROSA|nr:hypothetical protein FNV43_RR07918 [Rhamnella rubrinervis]